MSSMSMTTEFLNTLEKMHGTNIKQHEEVRATINALVKSHDVGTALIEENTQHLVTIRKYATAHELSESDNRDLRSQMSHMRDNANSQEKRIAKLENALKSIRR